MMGTDPDWSALKQDWEVEFHDVLMPVDEYIRMQNYLNRLYFMTSTVPGAMLASVQNE